MSYVYIGGFIVFAVGMLVLLVIAPDPLPKPRRRPPGAIDRTGKPPE